MICKIKNVECEHAGVITTFGCKEMGEPEGRHDTPVCYNDQINRDPTKCNRNVYGLLINPTKCNINKYVLLTRDLCARLCYGVKILVDQDKKFDGGIISTLDGINTYKGRFLFFVEGVMTPYEIEEIRPYLRSMSEMTDYEKEIFYSLNYKRYGQNMEDIEPPECAIFFSRECLDWLKINHFDYRGLIPQGLAIKVTKENNPYKLIAEV